MAEEDPTGGLVQDLTDKIAMRYASLTENPLEGLDEDQEKVLEFHNEYNLPTHRILYIMPESMSDPTPVDYEFIDFNALNMKEKAADFQQRMERKYNERFALANVVRLLERMLRYKNKRVQPKKITTDFFGDRKVIPGDILYIDKEDIDIPDDFDPKLSGVKRQIYDDGYIPFTFDKLKQYKSKVLNRAKQYDRAFYEKLRGLMRDKRRLYQSGIVGERGAEESWLTTFRELIDKGYITLPEDASIYDLLPEF